MLTSYFSFMQEHFLTALLIYPYAKNFPDKNFLYFFRIPSSLS